MSPLNNARPSPPFYACDLGQLKRVYASFERAFREYFERFEIGYSYKTNYTPLMLRHLHALGAKAEVVSMLEYQLARRLGVEPSRIIYNGPGKREEDVATALQEGAFLNLDSLTEVEHAVSWARRNRGASRDIGLRVNTTLPTDPPTRSRFGLGLESGELTTAAARLRGCPELSLTGLHAHHSVPPRAETQYRDIAARLLEAARALRLAGEVALDVGGGFGFAPPELAAVSFPDFRAYARAIADGLSDVPAGTTVKLVAEPGIAVVGTAYSYFAPVTALKTQGARELAFVDGSVHTVKPTRHPHNLPTTVLNAQLQEKASASELIYDIVGYTCMEDDYLGRGQRLPRLELGDVLRIDNVGAYTLVFKPPFIRGCPAVYLLHEDGSYELARREQDLAGLLVDFVM